MAIEVNPVKWWSDITITTPKKIERECQRYVTNKWSYNPSQSLRKGYQILLSTRFPGTSRDRYSDNGFYLEVIGIGNVPLAVAEWQWREDSSHGWEYGLMLPDTVYAFSAYVQLRSNEMVSCHHNIYYTQTPITEPLIENVDSHLYAFRKVMEFVIKKCC
jgi:hypothetical protein